jgi:hypothetical protein
MAQSATAQDPIRYPHVSEDGDIIPLEPPQAQNDFAYNRIFVAAVNVGHELVFTSQTAVDGGYNPDWTRIGDGLYANVVAAGTTLDGRVALVSADAKSGHVIYIAEAENGGTGAARWMTPDDLGLPAGVSSVATIAIARGVDGLDNIFISSPDNNKQSVWWKYRNPPTTETRQEQITPPGSTTPITVDVQVRVPPAEPWSDWININGALEGNLTQLSAANNADGRIVLTGIYSNGIPWVRQQTSDDPTQPESWSDWQLPGYPVTLAASTFCPILDRQGVVSVVASTNDGLIRSRQTQAGGANWTAWSAPGQVNDNVYHHACALNANDAMTIVVSNFAQQGVKNIIYATTQTHPETNQWTAWNRINALADISQLRLAASGNGTLTLFAFDASNGKVSAISQIGPDSTEWELIWTEIGGGIAAFALTNDLTPN